MTSKSFAFYTLGCKLNFSESSYLSGRLAAEGFRRAAPGETPSICIVNSCSVTDQTDKKCRQLIHRLHREYPESAIVVTGCYAQLKAAEIEAIEGVSLVLGANDKFLLPELLLRGDAESLVSEQNRQSPFYPSISGDDRTRQFLKVQDGCDYFCSYCTIPFARGRSRSGSISEVCAMAQRAVDEGSREIILTGVNTGDFGRRTGERFSDLIRALDKTRGEVRFRISSVEPDLLEDEIIEFVAGSEKFAPHFHLPLQSGCDATLKLMRRRYDAALFARKAELIKKLLPGAFIGCDVIAGMRGETREMFDLSLHFIEGLPLSKLHVFSYSERAGTAALRIEPVVDPSEKKRRSEQLLRLSAAKLADFYGSQIGTEHKVLWEGKADGGFMHGFTENYVRLRAPYDPSLVNQVRTITVTPENICPADE